MTPQEHEDGMRQEPTLSAAEKADGFAAVMKRLKSHSPDERARLQTQAEEALLGQEAYALGQEYLDRGNYEAARRWFRVAAGRHIPGAEQALEEISLRQTLDGFADLAAVGCDQAAADAMACGTIPSLPAVRAVDGNHRIKGDQPWASVMEGLYAGMAAAAQAQAGQITAQARREADAILTEARQQAERTAAACAEIVLDTEKDRREAAQLLAEARQEAESVQSEVEKIAERARRGARDILTKAQRQALLILDNAHNEATQIRDRARRQGGVSSRARTQVGGLSVWDFLRTSVEEGILGPSGVIDLIDFPCAPVRLSCDRLDGPADRLPVMTRRGQGALERLSQVSLLTGAVLLILGCGSDPTIWHWVRAPREGGEQSGAELRSTPGIRKKLPTVTVLRARDISTFEKVDPACVDGDWLLLCTDGLAEVRGSDIGEGLAALCESAAHPVLAFGVLRTDGENVAEDAELGAEGVGNSAAR